MHITFFEHFYQMWAPYEPFLPPRRMCGAGETSFMYLARALTQRGHEVTITCPTEYDGVFEGVRWTKDYIKSTDIAIAGESAAGLENIDAGLKIVDCQCNNLDISKREPIIDLIVTRSAWHSHAIDQITADIPLEKYRVIGNGVDLSQYSQPLPRIPGKILWTSSPDRGLHHLLRFFPRIREQIPKAELHVYYAFEPVFEGNRWGMNILSENVWRVKRALENTEGVIFHGGVGRLELIQAQQDASLLCYPCDTARWTEGFCVSLMEACASGLPSLTTACDALGEIYGGTVPMLEMPICDDDWVEVSVEMLTHPQEHQESVAKGQALAAAHSWGIIAEKWEKMLITAWEAKHGELPANPNGHQAHSNALPIPAGRL